VDSLARSVRIAGAGLPLEASVATPARVGVAHSPIARHVPAGLAWSTAGQWNALWAADVPAAADLAPVRPAAGSAELDPCLPMPGAARPRLPPAEQSGG
jgi:hypothetical protein